MASEPTHISADATLATSRPRAPWRRFAAGVTAVVFLISLAFPVVAGLSRDTESFPKWWGPLDVGVAFLLALCVFVIFGLAQGKMSKESEEAAYRSLRFLIHGVFVLLMVFFLFGDRIVWTNCLTGLAWRYWLLLYSLPAWLVVATN